MYWFKKCLVLVCPILVLLIVQSCKNDVHADNSAGQFFDLKKYFNDESLRLKKANPLITKMAAHNKSKETRQLRIADWTTELSLFTESDINKPAWKASYKVATQEGITTYNAIDTTLKTQYIIIKQQAGNVKLILIYNHIKKTLFGKVLYEATEHLSYVPDSLYKIQKRQFVRFTGFNNYYIKGLFN
ncbi:MAG TPA: hypothetical protein VJ844_10385 [Mucilaginibacter sp.]|nr:hypothetical protein [Mucilaginibacter sp.]